MKNEQSHWCCHVPILRLAKRTRRDTKDRPSKQSHERNQKKTMLELKAYMMHIKMPKSSIIQRKQKCIHFQHKHIHHDYSIDIKYIIAEMKHRQQAYLLVKNPATSYVAATFHPTIGQLAH